MIAARLTVGVDLVRVADVAESLVRFGDRYTARVYTPAERAYCAARGPASFAARFAAKEAVLKALRLEDRGVDWRNIEIERGHEGGCDVRLHGRVAAAARRRNLRDLAVSLTHEGEYAAALAVARMQTPAPAARAVRSS